MLCDFCQLYYTHWCFPGVSAVKNPPPMQETWIRSLSWEEPLEKEMATHTSVLACKKFLLLLNRGAWRAAVHRVRGGESWTQLATTPPTHHHLTPMCFSTQLKWRTISSDFKNDHSRTLPKSSTHFPSSLKRATTTLISLSIGFSFLLLLF